MRKQLKRAEMAKYFAKLEPCLIGSHHCIGCLMMVFHFDGPALRMSLK